MEATTRRTTRLLLCAALLGAAAPANATPPLPPARPDALRMASVEPSSGSLSNSVDSREEAYRPPGDAEHLPHVISSLRAGDFEEADIYRSKLASPAAQALAEWAATRFGAPLGFERLAAFPQTYPDWPATALLRRRTEEALLFARRPAAQVRAFFAERAPVTGAGRIALAFALKEAGAEAQAATLVQHMWREEDFGPDLERRLLDAFPGVLKTADHRFRMERLLLKERWGAAQRAAGYAGGDYASLARARMGIFQGGRKAEQALAAVPAHLRTDSSYIFSRALFLRRKKDFAGAAEVMEKAPRDPDVLADGDEWWNERRLIARSLLDAGEAKAAYAVASHHGAEGPAQRIEAEFHAGWIALRFLDEPEKAAKHFAEAANIASTPISLARAAYWQGRAAEAMNQAEEARHFYRRAAAHPITYYGQLARKKLGLSLVELRQPETLDAQGRARFDAMTPIAALRLLHAIGEEDLALALYAELAQALHDQAQLDALAALATEQGNARAILAVGKAAVQRGLPLDPHAYPVAGIPAFDTVGDEVEPAMVYAIARQESAFNPKAVSPAGARGLMQLMPATARRTAQRFGLGFNEKRLIEDPSYNAAIGSAHLSELMEDWRGSHLLAFASYNAGGGNVAKWIKAYGDPRKPDVDAVDWVERIPFLETRNYVQRVMENLAVYRARLAGSAPSAPQPRPGPPAPADRLPVREEARY